MVVSKFIPKSQIVNWCWWWWWCGNHPEMPLFLRGLNGKLIYRFYELLWMEDFWSLIDEKAIWIWILILHKPEKIADIIWLSYGLRFPRSNSSGSCGHGSPCFCSSISSNIVPKKERYNMHQHAINHNSICLKMINYMSIWFYWAGQYVNTMEIANLLGWVLSIIFMVIFRGKLSDYCRVPSAYLEIWWDFCHLPSG